MTVYVDQLMAWGWVMRGRRVDSCHMFADTDDELHAMAEAIGMKRQWFQNPLDGRQYRRRYDLTLSRRAAAVRAGAIEVDFREAGRMFGGGPPPERLSAVQGLPFDQGDDG